MIPSGIHFVYWSSVSKEGSIGPRTGFFHNFSQKEILAKKFDQQKEQFFNIDDHEEIDRFRANLQNMDRHLGNNTIDLINQRIT